MTQPGTPTPDAGESIAGLAERYWQMYVEAHPMNGTAFGDRRFDDRMDDLRPEATARYRTRLARLLEEARHAATAPRPATFAGPATADSAVNLASDDEVTGAALVGQIERELGAIDADVDVWTVDPVEGPQVSIFNVESFQTVDTPDQGRAMVARWAAMGTTLDQQAANLGRSLATGRVAARAPVAAVVDTLTQLLSQRDEAWSLINPARREHPAWSAAELTSFRDGLQAAVADEIRPALTRLRDMLRDSILPAARGDDAPGILHVPGGPEAYRLLIRHHVSLDIQPEALHATGLAEVARINGELEALGERLLGTRDRAAILERLRSDRDLYFRTSDEVADKAASALARARQAIPGWFGVLPRADCVVLRMGDHEAKHGTIAYYRQPAPNGSRPGHYYINATEPETRPRYEAEALAYHESIPGHHLQIALAQEVPGLPEFRKHLGATAFWEGWGLYAERLSDEMGLYSGDLDRIGMLSHDAWRACRLVVDTGMHAMGWTRQQAIDFMTHNSALAPNNIANEVDRYIAWPAQALAYKVGQLEMQQLRRQAEQRLGDAFDIRAFHDALLSGGALGLGAVREIVEARLRFDGR